MSKPVWFRPYKIEDAALRGKGTMSEHLGVEFLELGADFIKAKMPVDQRTKQPAGILHGGANVVLAETLASSAANMVVDPERFYCVGLEINANHIGSCKDGWVEGVSRPLHLGRTTQVWETRITQGARLVCVSRMTAAVLGREGSK